MNGKKNKQPTKEELLQILKNVEEEGTKPAAVKELFSSDGDMTLKSETPPRMIIPLVRMKIIEAAADPNRAESLVAVFIKEYDRRMVSLNRKGRLELLGALQALAEAESEIRVPMR